MKHHIVALILKKFTSLDVGKALLCTDFIIAASAFIVDSVIDNLNSCKYFIVSTSKRDEITDFIIKTLHHGVTVNVATGEFTGEERFMLHTVCKRIEAITLQHKIRDIDPHAFTIITTSSEIIGRGFSMSINLSTR